MGSTPIERGSSSLSELAAGTSPAPPYSYVIS